MTLADALDSLITDGRIAPFLAVKVLRNFDRAFPEVLSRTIRSTLKFKVRLVSMRPPPILDYLVLKFGLKKMGQGDLIDYRCCDNVWLIRLKNIEFKLPDSGAGRRGTSVEEVDRLTIVACRSAEC